MFAAQKPTAPTHGHERRAAGGGRGRSRCATPDGERGRAPSRVARGDLRAPRAARASAAMRRSKSLGDRAITSEQDDQRRRRSPPGTIVPATGCLAVQDAGAQQHAEHDQRRR